MAIQLDPTGKFLIDDNGNRASLEYWGDEDSARKSLESLTNCKFVINCSRCSDCSGCSGCSRCSDFAPAKVLTEIPVIPNIHTAIYEAASKPNAFDMGDFHSCGTKHCRAGWAIHLAGEAGYALERATSATFAAMRIYEASGYLISPVRFFETNDGAMADMRRLSELGRAATT